MLGLEDPKPLRHLPVELERHDRRAPRSATCHDILQAEDGPREEDRPVCAAWTGLACCDLRRDQD